MKHKRNVNGLKDHAQKIRQYAFNKTDRAIRQILKEGKPITFQGVAKVANVSVAWLYKEKAIKERIEALRKQPIQKVEVAKNSAITLDLMWRLVQEVSKAFTDKIVENENRIEKLEKSLSREQ